MKKLAMLVMAVFSTVVTWAAIDSTQIPADATGIAVVDVKAILASPFGAAVKAANPDSVRHFNSDDVVRVTVAQTPDCDGTFIETARDAETSFRATMTAREKKSFREGKIAGRKAFFVHNDAAVIINPHTILTLTGTALPKKGATYNYEKFAAKFLSPKAPKMSKNAKLARFLNVPAGQWAYGYFLPSEFSNLTGGGAPGEINPFSALQNIDAVFFQGGPGRAPASGFLYARAICKDATTATGIFAFANMMKGVMSMDGGGDDKNAPPPELAAIISNIQIALDGSKVNLSVELPASLIKRMAAQAAPAPGSKTATKKQ